LIDCGFDEVVGEGHALPGFCPSGESAATLLTNKYVCVIDSLNESPITTQARTIIAADLGLCPSVLSGSILISTGEVFIIAEAEVPGSEPSRVYLIIEAGDLEVMVRLKEFSKKPCCTENPGFSIEDAKEVLFSSA